MKKNLKTFLKDQLKIQTHVFTNQESRLMSTMNAEFEKNESLKFLGKYCITEMDCYLDFGTCTSQKIREKVREFYSRFKCPIEDHSSGMTVKLENKSSLIVTITDFNVMPNPFIAISVKLWKF